MNRAGPRRSGGWWIKLWSVNVLREHKVRNPHAKLPRWLLAKSISSATSPRPAKNVQAENGGCCPVRKNFATCAATDQRRRFDAAPKLGRVLVNRHRRATV